MIMKKQTLSTLLASGIILGSGMVGCSSAGINSRVALGANNPGLVAPRIEKELANKDYARALMLAEQLVASEPKDAGHRALLGRAYLANGRYASARTAFKDAMTLGNRDVRTIVSLALSETGLGNAAAARQLLSENIDSLPAADYGLAMAMAGAPQEGVRALLEATKQPDATAQTRQNLAYALALGGAWGQARLIAGQDMTAREAEARIGQWSQATQAGNDQQRVFAMVGVSPRGDDAGLPAQLALNMDGAPVQMAAASTDLVGQARADAQAEPVADEPAPVAVPVAVADAKPASPDTVAVAMAFDSSTSMPVPLIRASSDPMRQAARAAFQRSEANGTQALIGRASMSRIARIVSTPVKDAETSDWVIQLGAFDSEAVAQEKWARISRGKPSLGKFHQIHSEFAMNGHAFHRLAVRGFGDRASAYQMCHSLRADGQACFVRLDDTDSTRMARAGTGAKGAPQVAMRKVSVGGKQVASR